MYWTINWSVTRSLYACSVSLMLFNFTMFLLLELVVMYDCFCCSINWRLRFAQVIYLLKNFNRDYVSKHLTSRSLHKLTCTCKDVDKFMWEFSYMRVFKGHGLFFQRRFKKKNIFSPPNCKLESSNSWLQEQ